MSDEACSVQKGVEIQTGRHKGRPRPNYFIAVPVNDQIIRQNVSRVHESLLEANNDIKKFLTPVEELHITLLVVRLSKEKEALVAELRKAEEAMKAAVKSIEKFFVEQQVTRLHIPFTGLGHFGSNVLFAQLETDENKQILEKMAEIVRTTFNENKIELPDIRPFNPHLTVAKVKFDKSLKWHKQKKTENVKIKAEYYETLKDTTFGLQQIETIQFCSMLDPKQDCGYYHTNFELKLPFYQAEDEILIDSTVPGGLLANFFFATY